MSNLSNSHRIESLAARGYHPVIRKGKLAISPPGAPEEIRAEVAEHADEIVAALLGLPAELADRPTEELKALALRLAAFMDGSEPWEKRIRFLPYFERLLERIAWREEGGGHGA